MNVRLLNRISGEMCRSPLGSALPGQYQSLPDVFDLCGEFLIPDENGQWRLEDQEQGQVYTGLFWDCGEVPKRERQSLREIRLEVQSVLAQGGQLADWLAVSPVVAGSRATLQPFDVLLLRDLWHLQEVCHKPITHLESEEARLPVQRVRRASSRAPDYLASHTEDWEYRKITSVVPKRVLAVQSEELYDIYENRLAVQLVDRLLRYLAARCEEAAKIDDWGKGLRAGTRWKRERIYTVLAKAVESDIDEMGRAVSRARSTLERLYHEVLGLLGSPLYQAMPRVRRQYLGAQDTNILVNDRHYRYVALLWRKCLETEYMRPKTPRETRQEAEEVIQGFDAFCALLLIKGMELLGFIPEEGRPWDPGQTSRWKRGTIAGEVTWNPDGSIKVRLEGSENGIIFVPLAAPLSSVRRAGVAEQIRTEVAGQLSSRLKVSSVAKVPALSLADDLVVLLYPGDAKERECLAPLTRHRLMTLGNDLHEPELLGFLPVSSYELDTLERVGRALQWALLRPQILNYPPQIALPEVAKDLLRTAGWVRPSQDRGRASVLRTPREDENRRFDEAFRAKLGPLRVGGRRQQQQVSWLTTFKTDLEASYPIFDLLLQCPVCHKVNPTSTLRPSLGEHFVCECVECHSEWGTKACGKCGSRYAFVTPRGDCDSAIDHAAGWVDAAYGLDVLAVPCWLPDHGNVHICPDCGRCGNSGRDECAECTRCSADWDENAEALIAALEDK